MDERMRAKWSGLCPRGMSLDNGCYTVESVELLRRGGMDACVATGRLRHGEAPRPASRGRIPKGLTIKVRLARKLRVIRGRCAYAERRAIVEPVIGQFKGVRGFRRFLLRGMERVRYEFDLICLIHNLLKLFRYGREVAPYALT